MLFLKFNAVDNTHTNTHTHTHTHTHTLTHKQTCKGLYQKYVLTLTLVIKTILLNFTFGVNQHK